MVFALSRTLPYNSDKKLFHRRKVILMPRHENRKHPQCYTNRQDMQKFQGKFRQLHDQPKHRHRQFLQHYKYLRYFRPAGILFTMLIFYLVVSWAGNKEIGILFALLLAVKEFLHFFYMWRLEKRIFKPMINLKQGLDEVAKGNYTIKVNNDISSDLDIVIDAFNEMTGKLAESEKLQAEYEENRKALITNISHDLKTPITAIQGYVEALIEDSVNSAENKSKYLETIHHNAVYVNKLIDDLFLFAKLDMQKLEFQYRCIKLRAFMDDLMEEYQLEFAERKVQFHYDAQLEDDVLVELDGKRFRQAVNNILNNAIQHGPAAGLSIRVTLSRQVGFVCIDIQDNGPGIPEEKLPFVFDRFYRINSERPKEVAGTGLGLAIAKELIEAHQGKITVSSIVNKGSRFTILLPVWQDNGGKAVNETHLNY